MANIIDFINAAFPWVVMGLGTALFCTYSNNKMKE